MRNIARSSRNGPSNGGALQNCSTRCSDDSLSVHNLPCHSFCILKSIPTKSKHTSSCSHALSAEHRHSGVRTGGTHSYHCALSLVSNFCICVSTRNIASPVYGPATSISACTAQGSGSDIQTGLSGSHSLLFQ
jgi:predicted small secreted protein